MADSSVAITSGAGTSIDTRTESTNSNHRQVMVVGDPVVNDSIAVVRATDPASNDEGVVVRDVNTSAVVSGLRDVRVQSIVDGTVSVGTIENVTRVKNLVDGTISTLGTLDYVTRVRNIIDGTISTLGTLTRVDRVMNVIDGTLSTVASVTTVPTVTRVDRVHNLVDGTISSGTLDYVTRVRNLVDGTLSTVDTVVRTNRVMNLIDGTLSTVTGVDRVRNLVDGTISSGTLDYVTRVRNVVDGTLTTVTGVDRVRNVVDGTLSLVTMAQRVNNLVDGTLSLVSMAQRVNNVVDGTLSNVYRVHNLIAGTVTVTGITASAAVHILSTNGTMAVNIGTLTNTAAIMAKDGTFAVFFSPANPKVTLAVDVLNISGTASVAAAGGSVAGSTSGVSVSGVTLVAPEASRNIKVYAFSLTTTAQVHNQVRFTNGAGTTPTTFWQLALQAPSAGIAGANLAVSPPAYLFATGAGNTLSLLKDTASLVHYSISYFKESA